MRVGNNQSVKRIVMHNGRVWIDGVESVGGGDDDGVVHNIFTPNGMFVPNATATKKPKGLNGPPRCIILPCAHQCVCSTCARKLGDDGKALRGSAKCPICQAGVDAIKKPYLV